MSERKEYAYGRIGSDYAEIRCVRLGLNSCSGSGMAEMCIRDSIGIISVVTNTILIFMHTKRNLIGSAAASRNHWK